jgi:hypothetical protein
MGFDLDLIVWCLSYIDTFIMLSRGVEYPRFYGTYFVHTYSICCSVIL